MYLIVAAILCLTAVPVTPSHHEIHKRMTPGQVQQVFGTTHENIPSYKLVNVEVSSMQKRDTQYRRPVRIYGPGRDVNLVLKPTDGFLAGEKTRVTAAIVMRKGIRYRNYRDTMKRVGEQLVDPPTGSSLVLSRNRNRRYALDGNIESENLVIRSLPEELVDSLYSNNSNHHVIFEPKMEPFKPDHANNLFNVTQLRLALSRNSRSVPDIIFPELLLVVDASSFKLHGSDIIRTVRYTLILWNSIDMRYRNLRSPVVRLNIARIIIAKEPRGTPYIESSMVNRNTVDASNVLTSAAHYFYRIRKIIPLNSYDAIVAVTQHNLVYQNSNILGLAQRGGVCSVDFYGRSVRRVAFYHDAGSHWSVIPAHELGHVLGARHDHSICSAEDGYIMSPSPKSSINSWDFSACSIRDIQNTIQLNPQCLVDAPTNAGDILPTVVMDKSETVAEQCRLVSRTKPCRIEVKKEEFCRTLICKHPINLGRCVIHFGHNLAEGTPCDDGKRCIKGECVGE